MPDFEKILNEHINHSMVLDKDGVIKAMSECYNLGYQHSDIKFNLLKNTFEFVLEEYVPDIHQEQLKKELVKSGI
jgi:hypothetical protein